MPDRIEFRAITANGTPGDLIASATAAGHIVTYSGDVAESTVRALADRFGRTEADIFSLIRSDGWSNGWLMAVNAT